MGAEYAIALAVGSAVAKTVSSEEQLQAQQDALRLRATQERIAATNRMIQHDRQMERVISEQNVMAGASGITPGSFSPIQEESFDEFALDKNAEKLNEKWKQYAIESNINNLEAMKPLVVFENLFDAAQATYKYQSIPEFPELKPEDDIVNQALK